MPCNDVDVVEDDNDAYDDDDYDDDQVKSMVNLVDDIAANALKSMVAGEELDTAAPLGRHHHHLHNHDADDDNFHFFYVNSCQE